MCIRDSIYLGGEVAPSVPIHVIGDQPGGTTAVPGDCSSTGGINENTPALLGANGILGVGLFANDCDACLFSAVPTAYYICTATGCTKTRVTSAQVVQNPVALFQQDNNGVLIDLLAVSSVGATTSLTGSLIFGIGTQSVSYTHLVFCASKTLTSTRRKKGFGVANTFSSHTRCNSPCTQSKLR